MIELSYIVVVWLKALHIISVITWMAGLLYLPRLFVYHCESAVKSENADTFLTMERKLLKFIMNPSAVVVFFFRSRSFGCYTKNSLARALGMVQIGLSNGIIFLPWSNGEMEKGAREW